jgi:hypothetical protein
MVLDTHTVFAPPLNMSASQGLSHLALRQLRHRLTYDYVLSALPPSCLPQPAISSQGMLAVQLLKITVGYRPVRASSSDKHLFAPSSDGVVADFGSWVGSSVPKYSTKIDNPHGLHAPHDPSSAAPLSS